MLDFGWPELLIIMAIAVFVVGPDDIPKIMYGLGRIFRRFQYMRYAISQQFEEVLKHGDIEELRKGVNFEAKDYPQTDYNEAQSDQAELINDQSAPKKEEPEEDKEEKDNVDKSSAS